MIKVKHTGKKPKLSKPILVEGLPGIGNVGKIAVDFLIDETKAKKFCEISSYSFPHSVFVNEDNLVELPIVELFYKKGDGRSKKDIIFLSGDVQPTDEFGSYEFSEKVLDIAGELDVGLIITLGGIGLPEAPKAPKVYCTGNSKDAIKKYKNSANDKLYGVVGPIVGVSGLLLGLAEKRNIPAISFLAETHGHPMYLGIKGAREMLKVLGKSLGLRIDLNKLDKEIKEMESELIKKTGELAKISQQTALKKLKRKIGKEVSYIG